MSASTVKAAWFDRLYDFVSVWAEDDDHEAGYRAISNLLATAEAEISLAAPAVDGAEMIAIERQGQTDREGYTPEHDASHDDGELICAALAYAMWVMPPGPRENAEDFWPWGDGWNPSDDATRNLAKAGALLAAEIDRLQLVAGAEATS